MAVRIVEVNPDPKIVKRVVCRGCGATLEYVPNDVKEKNLGKDMAGDSSGMTYVKCPNCKKEAIINAW